MIQADKRGLLSRWGLEQGGKHARKRCNKMGFRGDIKTEKKPHRPKHHQPSKTTKKPCKKHNKQKNNRSKQENPTNPTLSMLQIFRFAYNQNLPQVHAVFLTDFKEALGPFLLFHLQFRSTPKLAMRLVPAHRLCWLLFSDAGSCTCTDKQSQQQLGQPLLWEQLYLHIIWHYLQGIDLKPDAFVGEAPRDT